MKKKVFEEPVHKMKYYQVGTKVQTTKRIQWHGLDIPKGTEGEITMMYEDGAAAKVKFDDGRKYGSFDCWADELRVVK